MLHRRDINDEIWKKLNVNLHESVGHTGRNGVDNCRFINAVFWILRAATRCQVRRGRTCRRSMVTGKIRIGGLQCGEPEGFGTKQNIEISDRRVRSEQYYDWCDIREMSYARKWCKRWKSRHGSLKRRLNTKVHATENTHIQRKRAR